MTELAKDSRDAVLDAAEALFAERGHDGTSIEEIGRSAGLSRGSPGYLFGSKQGLYRAVLERATARAEARLAPMYAFAPDGTPEGDLGSIIDAYVDFQVEHPRLVKLLQWEALTGRMTGELPGQVEAVGEAREFMENLLGVDASAKPRLFLLSVFALCSYPFAPHAAGVMEALGFDPTDPEFRSEYTEHVKDLAQMVLELSEPEPAG